MKPNPQGNSREVPLGMTATLWAGMAFFGGICENSGCSHSFVQHHRGTPNGSGPCNGIDSAGADCTCQGYEFIGPYWQPAVRHRPPRVKRRRSPGRVDVLLAYCTDGQKQELRQRGLLKDDAKLTTESETTA
jgi:hypothetical protein